MSNRMISVEAESDQPSSRPSTPASRNALLACASFHRPRFYLFTTQEPTQAEDRGVGRDVLNERPTGDAMLAA